MILIDGIRFSIRDESDLHRRCSVIKLTFPSSGKSVILGQEGTVLSRLKDWLSERRAMSRLKWNNALARDLTDSAVIQLEVLWSGHGDLAGKTRTERLVELYDKMYGFIGEQRTYKPYGHNDLTLRHHEGGQNASGAVMRLRRKLGLHRVVESDGSVSFVQCAANQRKKPRNNYKILQFDMGYNFIKAWDSYADIVKEYGFKRSTLKDKANQRRLTRTGEADNALGGFRWFIDYRADWYEKEYSDGGFRFVGKYDLDSYNPGKDRHKMRPSRTKSVNVGRRPLPPGTDSHTVRGKKYGADLGIETAGDRSAFIIMGGIINE